MVADATVVAIAAAKSVDQTAANGPTPDSAASILALIFSPAYKIPMLPTQASEAMAMANDADMSFQEVSKLLECDPILGARILSVANSPLYARRGVVTALRTALLRLGSNTLRDVLTQAVAEAYIFRGGAAKFLRQQRTHAVGVAHITRIVCRTAGHETEGAFVCGLLHDLGRFLAYRILEEERSVRPDLRANVLDEIHCEIGGRVCQAWDLPDRVREAAQRHHDYGIPGDAGYSPIGNAIAAAQVLAYHLGLGDRQETIDLDHPSFRDLGLNSDHVEELLRRTEDLSRKLG